MSLLSASSPVSISLRLTDSDITILKLDQKQHQILHLFQQPLPPNVITKGVIVDKAQLSAQINSAINKAHIRGETVCVGFPEDRTFINFIDIRGIPKDDLAEAIHWQAQETVPIKLDNLFSDWQLIAADTEAAQALFVSAPQDFLKPIISSLVAAGVKPISCEPTSISLSRLVPGKEIAAVIEIRRQQSTLIIVDTTKTVRLSTIIASPSDIVPEITRMLNFFDKKYHQQLTVVYVCGEGATSEWQNFLASQTQLKVLDLPLTDIKQLPASPSRFAVAISLAQKLPLPSSDPQTINLLPPEIEFEYEQKAQAKSVSFSFKLSLITTFLTALIMFAAFAWIQIASNRTQIQITAEEQNPAQASYSDLAKEAEAANFQARIINRLPLKDNLSSTLNDFSAAIPSGITISSYTLDLSENVFLVNGHTPTRDLLLKFKANLEAEKSFDLVTIPLPTLEKKQDIDFSIAINIKASK